MTLKEDIAGGETNLLEFKLSIPKDPVRYVKTAVAFANCKGGRIVFGVSDDRRIVGVDGDPYKLADQIIDTIANEVEPQIDPVSYVHDIDGKSLIEVIVHIGSRRPYHLRGLPVEEGAYVRISASSRLASEETLDDLRLEGKRRSFDEMDYLELSENGAAQRSIERLCSYMSGRSGRKVTEEYLVSRHLLRREDDGRLVPTRGFMLLTDNPYPYAVVKCARFHGTDKVEFIDRKEFGGSIVSQVEEATDFVMSHVGLASRIEGLYREDIPELPPKAIREVVTNAVIHRSYNLEGESVMVFVFDDRVEIWSPGLLPGGMTVQGAMSGGSKLRNQWLALFFRDADLTEGYGTGLLRAQDALRKFGLPPMRMEEVDDRVVVTIYRAAGLVQQQNADSDPEGVEELVLSYLELESDSWARAVSVDVWFCIGFSRFHLAPETVANGRSVRLRRRNRLPMAIKK